MAKGDEGVQQSCSATRDRNGDLAAGKDRQLYKTMPLKLYTFEIDGHEDNYYRVLDVKEHFLKPIYRSDVLQAIKYVKQEMKMRSQVFKDDTIKRDRKMKEMELVLQVLTRCSDKYPDLQKQMFEE
jgi:hypothetical protein